MRFFVIFSVLILLSGCASYQHAEACHREVGARPGEALAWFGLIGAIVMVSSDGDREWRERMDRCMSGESRRVDR